MILDDTIIEQLIEFSRNWEAEDSCYGYRANSRQDFEGRRVFLSFEDGRITGYLFGRCYNPDKMRSVLPEGSNCFEVEELYVVPEMRGRGTGSALFKFAEDAVAQQAEFITLATATKNWRAILHFYIEELGMEFHSASLFKRIKRKAE